MNTDQKHNAELQETYEAGKEFNELFESLLAARQLTHCTSDKEGRNTEAKVKQKIEDSLDRVADSFAPLVNHAEFSHHIIGRYGSWVGMICKWQANTITRIQGHPAFSFYHVVDGNFSIDHYKRVSDNRVKSVNSMSARPGDILWEHGENGSYDNMIHRVWANTCGYTLQLFSENPSLGRKFSV